VAAFSLPLKLNILVAIAAVVVATLVMAQAGKAAEAMRARHRRWTAAPCPAGRSPRSSSASA
jgi:hypothetical protein